MLQPRRHRELDPRHPSDEATKIPVPPLAMSYEERVGFDLRADLGDEEAIGERRDTLSPTDRVDAAQSEEDLDLPHGWNTSRSAIEFGVPSEIADCATTTTRSGP
jgi:hypothetical protein